MCHMCCNDAGSQSCKEKMLVPDGSLCMAGVCNQGYCMSSTFMLKYNPPKTLTTRYVLELAMMITFAYLFVTKSPYDTYGWFIRRHAHALHTYKNRRQHQVAKSTHNAPTHKQTSALL